MASIKLELGPWTPPNFVRVTAPAGTRQDGINELPSVAVKDLTQEVFNGLAEEWLVALYREAGKPMPWRR